MTTSGVCQRVEPLLRGVMQTGVAHVGHETLLKLDRQGTGAVEDTYWTFIYAPLQGDSGQVERVIAICNEVTEPVRARQELERLAAEVTAELRERQRVEQVLRESEARQRAILTQALFGVAVTDLTGHFVEVNQAYCDLTGYTAQELLATDFPTITHPEDRDANMVLIRQMLGGQLPGFVIEKRYVRKDGGHIWVRNAVSLIRDGAGRPVHLVALTYDLTERKQAEETLREQTEVVETINRVGQTLAVELDLPTLVQAVTDAATTLTGAQFGAFFYNVSDARGESYMLYTLSGTPREQFAQFPIPRNTALFEPTFRGTGVVRLADVRQDLRYGKNAPYSGLPPGHLPVTSYLAVPVLSRAGDVLGGLFFGHPEAGVFTDRHERLVVGLAAQAAVALDNAQLFEALHQAHATLEQRVQERTALVELMQDITKAANAAPRSAEALQYAVDRLCRYTGWPVGHAYLAAAPGIAHWVPTPIWHLDAPEHLLAFQQATQTLECAAGEDMIGQVGALAKPAWGVEVATEPTFRRRYAALEAGLTAGFALPILVGSEVAGVLEFYAYEPPAPNPALLNAMTQMGIQLGRVIERERAAALVQRQQEKLAAMSTMLASVAHELNNPLATILLQAELVGEDVRGGPLAEPVADIAQAAARCERLVRQFVTLARQHPPERSVVALNRLVAETVPKLPRATNQQLFVT